jgi:hypothetical protein
MKTWPTKKQKSTQMLVALLMTLSMMLSGVTMVLNFRPFLVFSTILMAFFAILQWGFYLKICIQIEMREVLTEKTITP